MPDLTKPDHPSEAAPAGRPSDIKAVPVRHPGRWVAAVVIVVLAAMLVHTLVFSKDPTGRFTRFRWGVINDYLFSEPILHGLWYTILLTVIGMAIGIVGGVVLAVMRLSSNPILSGVGWVYIWFFRGTPLLVQITFWWVGIAALYPQLSLGIPFGPEATHFSANSVITPLAAGCIGLGLNEAAYMAEIVRAGILSVGEGQSEAASSLGMGRALTMRRIVLPQAMRVIVPPTGNELISMLKNSSLASAATVTELFYEQNVIAARTYYVVPLLITVSLWYLFLTSVLTVGQFYVERYFARGSVRQLPPTPLQRFRALAFGRRTLPPATMALDATVLGVGRGGSGT